jgi:predicted ribosomally synthesized peptide with nif11-like leader
MTFSSAQLFVQRMREDSEFRNSVSTIGDRVELWKYIKTKGFDFDACQLVNAMAACMAELEQMSSIETPGERNPLSE